MGTDKTIYIIGAGGHGKVVADIAKQNGYKKIVFIDDSLKDSIDSYKIVGTMKDIEDLHSLNKDADFFIAIGDNAIREHVYIQLKKYGITLPVLKHPQVVIDETVQIGEGTIIMPNSVINAGSFIGKCCIINTAATIDHDCSIKDFTHVSPGVHMAGTVHVGNRCWLGIGTNVINNISICDDCIIGAGSTVIKDINDKGTYVGTPVRMVK